MKIKSVAVNRFRGYERRVCMEIDDLRVLVGKNDIGKSTILEALDIFFNEGKGSVKLDKSDINKSCLSVGEDVIEIEVEFTNLPQEIVIDASNPTTLRDEHLLTDAGTLRVVKKYSGAGNPKTFIRALHPTAPGCADLLQKKISELRKTLDDLRLECADRTKSAELRRSIWASQNDLLLADCDIEISKEDTKSIWDQLKICMPMYILFQSDRKNADSDDEVQDPMRIAVREILSDPHIQEKLADVANTVKARLDEVSYRTVEKLRELSPSIANSLTPQIPEAAALKWADVFKSVSIFGDDSIPINKRGSGVKRLVLISFFRAEAERRLRESGLPSIIYAIEEPETSQHPEHQRSLADALIELSAAENTQVIFTTHSPEIVKRLKFEDLLIVSSCNEERLSPVLVHDLPYPSLNEVNFSAFGEATPEYHNELYGFIESEQRLDEYKRGKPTRRYIRVFSNGGQREEQKILSEYIRHQIHHPENRENLTFTPVELANSIEQMRLFLRS